MPQEGQTSYLIAAVVQNVHGAIERAKGQDLVRDAQTGSGIFAQQLGHAGPQALVLEPGLLLLDLLLLGAGRGLTGRLPVPRLPGLH